MEQAAPDALAVSDSCASETPVRDGCPVDGMLDASVDGDPVDTVADTGRRRAVRPTVRSWNSATRRADLHLWPSRGHATSG